MLENLSSLKIVKDNRTYFLHLSPDSPLGEVFDVLTEMRNFVVHKMIENQPKTESEGDENG